MVSESAPEVYCYVSVVSESVSAVFLFFIFYGYMVLESVPAVVVFVMAV